MLSVTLLAPLFSLSSFKLLNRWVPISHCVDVHQFIFQPFSLLIYSVDQSVNLSSMPWYYINWQISVSFLFYCWSIVCSRLFSKMKCWWIEAFHTLFYPLFEAFYRILAHDNQLTAREYYSWNILSHTWIWYLLGLTDIQACVIWFMCNHVQWKAPFTRCTQAPSPLLPRTIWCGAWSCYGPCSLVRICPLYLKQLSGKLHIQN